MREDLKKNGVGLRKLNKVQIAGICQDLAQLKALYKERWESFLANAGVVQGFTPNDLSAAGLLARGLFNMNNQLVATGAVGYGSASVNGYSQNLAGGHAGPQRFGPKLPTGTVAFRQARSEAR
jgi:type IV secretion system protein VirD4